MPRKIVTEVSSRSNEKLCCFCGLGDNNELQYGKFYEHNGILTHYYCLLLSSNMQQKGRDDEGILGFLPDDINKELKRGKRLICCYCKKSGATLGCCNTKCKKIFHFPCGLKSGSLHQFFGEFRSYCKNHRPNQNIDVRVSEEVNKRDDMICYICYDDVSPADMYGTLWAPCCKKNAWFHRTCVQQLAMSAGYFFKCPLCNNKAEFQRAMLDQGIFIPSQDASWELVPNAFEELLYRHNRCDADDCLCPKGREHTSSNAKWELTLCRTCGSQGIHMACGNLKWVKPIWECTECTSILNKSLASDSESSSVLQTSRHRRRLREDENSMDDESSDSDISVGTEAMEPSTSNSPCPKSQSDEPPDSPPALRITRRSVIPIPKSPVNTKTSNPKTATRNEDLPPGPKRPRYSDHVIQEHRSDSIDSDDDIVVISGPSGIENSASNGRNSPVERLADNSWSDKPTTRQLQYQSPKKEPEEFKKCEKTAYVALDKFEMPQPTAAIRVPINNEKTVVEIDLSEAEYTIPESRPKPLVNDRRVVGSCVDPPECNFMITNVTSLAPEAFENAEDQKIELKPNLPNVPSRTSIYNESNGGLTSQTPIVLDDEPLPVAPNNCIADNNNLPFLPIGIHDEIKIIRYDYPIDADGKPTNIIRYGITIPGTNQTVPLIFAPAENTNLNTTSETTSGFNPSNENHSENNKLNSPPASLIPPSNGLKPAEKQQIPSTTPIRNNEASNASSSLSPSVPLKAIVNERFSTSRSHRKSNDNKTLIVRNQSSLDQAFGTRFSTKKSDLQAQKIASKNPVPKDVQPSATKNSVPKAVQPSATKNSVPKAVQPSATKNSVPKAVQPSATKNSVPKTVQPIAPKNPVPKAVQPSATKNSVLQAQPIVPNGALIKVAGAPIFPKLPHQPPMTPVSNFGSSITLKQPLSNAQANKTFPFLPHDPSSTAEADSPLPNGIISSTTATSRTVQNMLNQNKPLTVNAILPDENTTWLHPSGSLIKVNSSTAKTGVTPPNLYQSTQLEIQSSAKNERQIPGPQLFRLIRTDSDNGSNDDCDGDAGSDPPDQPASADTSTITKPRHVTKWHSERDEPLEVGNEHTHDRRTSTTECDADTLNAANRSASSDRSDSCNRTGLIYKSINLRDIKFSVCGSNIIKMALYDTYSVNIKLDSLNPSKNSKYSSCKRTIKSSLDRETQNRNIENEDANDVSNSLDFRTSAISSDNDGANQAESTSQDNDSFAQFATQITDLPSTDVVSRGQEELKENLDPIPLSTNSSPNSTNTVDRKSKFRIRSGVDHSMRSLNEKEGQQMISEKNEDRKKITPHGSQSLENHSKVLYNGWKDTECHGEANVQNVSIVRSVEIMTKNVPPRSSVIDNTVAEDFDLIYACKRKRISTNDGNLSVKHNFVEITTTKESTDHNNENVKDLVKAERILERKSKLNDNFSRFKKILVNSTINRLEDESLSCKVSIDLARIQSVPKLISFAKTIDCKFNWQHITSLANDCDTNDLSDSASVATLYRFQSFDNLTSDPDEDTTVVKLRRKWKSLDDLCCLFSRSCVKNTVENKMQGYKKKRRSFEEHDCVR